ncbi:7788_t:CDS:2 [Ambispora gerdemannii]|uniref:7788_t:CDS:1 n=1 Tax=Ambispora gerdemannii TaxID=144530 RepID=A0A9N8YM38_9GLOM|nr:7788_t:CDS:2 [Ambispora gerdemannii]
MPNKIKNKPTSTSTIGEKIGMRNLNKNQYINVVQKRLRSLVKRRVKYLQYEEMLKTGNQTLNQDQLQSLELKDKVEFAIGEFKSIIKSLNFVENEVQETEHEESIAKAVKQTKDFYLSSIISLLQFFRLVHYQNVSIVQLAEIDNEAVTHFRDLLNHLAGETLIEEKKEQSIREVIAHVEKLRQGDEEVVHRPVSINGAEDESIGISYYNIRSLAINPPIPESFDEIISPEETDQDIIEETIPIHPLVEHSYPEDTESEESLNANENTATQINNNSPEIFDENYHEDNDSQHQFLQQIDNNPPDFQYPSHHIVTEQQTLLPNNEPSQQPENSADDIRENTSVTTQKEENTQSQNSATTTRQITKKLSSVNDDNEIPKSSSSQVISDHEQSSKNTEILEVRSVPPNGFKFMFTPDNLKGDESLDANENTTTQINNNSPEIFDENYHEDNDSQHQCLQIDDNPSDFQYLSHLIVTEQQTLPPPNNEPSQQPEKFADDIREITSITTQKEENTQSKNSAATTQQITNQQQSSVNDDNEIPKSSSQVISNHKQIPENQTENNNLTQSNNPSPQNISPKSQEANNPSPFSNSPNPVHSVVSHGLNQNQRNAGEKLRDPRSENGQTQSSRPIQRRNNNRRYNNQQRQTDRRRSNYTQNGQGRNGPSPRNSRLSPKSQSSHLSKTNLQQNDSNYLNNVTPTQKNTAYPPRSPPKNLRSDPQNKVLPRPEQPKDPVNIQSTQPNNPLVHPLPGYQQLIFPPPTNNNSNRSQGEYRNIYRSNNNRGSVFRGNFREGNNGYLNNGGNYQINGYLNGRGVLNRNGAGYQGVRSNNNTRF